MIFNSPPPLSTKVHRDSAPLTGTPRSLHLKQFTESSLSGAEPISPGEEKHRDRNNHGFLHRLILYIQGSTPNKLIFMVCDVSGAAVPCRASYGARSLVNTQSWFVDVDLGAGSLCVLSSATDCCFTNFVGPCV